MKGILLKRNDSWLIEYTTINGAPNLIQIHPEYVKYYFLDEDADGVEVEFEVVTYNQKGSAYNNLPHDTYAKLIPQTIQQEIKDIEDSMNFICQDPDCPHCIEEINQMEDDDLTDDEWLIKQKHLEIEATAIDFAKWLAKDWMSIWVEDKWMWECINEQSELYTKYEYLSEEQLFELYKASKK
jgi:diaminopimelate epimerase